MFISPLQRKHRLEDHGVSGAYDKLALLDPLEDGGGLRGEDGVVLAQMYKRWITPVLAQVPAEPVAAA